MIITQSIDQPVNIAVWRRDEEFEQYPEGARDKTLVYCPVSAPYDFLKTSHRYLFKKSSHRYPEQYWVEILAYRISTYMGIIVPPAFVAYDEKINQSAALIEWFYSPLTDIYIAGGNYFKRLIPNFDEKSGCQHNFETIRQIFGESDFTRALDWQTYWAKALAFDALIGNTDRHQDNWGIIIRREKEAPHKIKEIHISPVFDNGTSMGHEIAPFRLQYFEIENRLKTYVLRGKHHMRWALDDKNRIGHAEMLTKIACLYPQTRQIMLDCLRSVNDKIFSKILDDLIKFDVPVKLTPKRAFFMLELLSFRHKRLLNELDR